MTRMNSRILAAGALAACIAALVGFVAVGPVTAQVTTSAAATKVEITEASFSCIRDMTPVRGFFVGNLLGDMEGTLKAANTLEGAVYPVGSVVQLVPTEAMVKREAGFSAATKDWEFFELGVTPAATTIRVRGTHEAVNRFGGNCLSCHIQAKPEFDLICENTHGCAPIPITPVMAKAIQNTDPRCAPVANLPPEQVEALKQLAAFAAAAAPKP